MPPAGTLFLRPYLAAGSWFTTGGPRVNWNESKRRRPQAAAGRQAAAYRDWKKAVDRTLNWVDVN